MDEKVVTLNDFRERKGTDVGTLIKIHKEISVLRDQAIREKFENLWHQIAIDIISSTGLPL